MPNAPWRTRLRRAVGSAVRKVGVEDPRDAEIAELRERLAQARRRRRVLRRQLDAARAELDRERDGRTGPSHVAQLTAAWREWRLVRAASGVEEGRQFDNKLTSYAFAQSHGVPVPALHHRWEAIGDIDVATLASEAPGLMLKAAHSAAAHGVVATDDAEDLRAALDRWQELADVDAPLHLDPPIIAPPYFTEERLGRPGEVLLDVKVFAYYGEVAQVMLLSAPDFRDRSAVTVRLLTPAGEDLGDVITTAVVDPGLPTPRHLPGIVAAAERLSRALRRPFTRVDFYDTGDRFVLGEITPMPGNVNRYVRSHDTFLGERWELARARMRMDVAAGIDARVEWGPGPRELAFASAPPWQPPASPRHR